MFGLPSCSTHCAATAAMMDDAFDMVKEGNGGVGGVCGRKSEGKGEEEEEEQREDTSAVRWGGAWGVAGEAWPACTSGYTRRPPLALVFSSSSSSSLLEREWPTRARSRFASRGCASPSIPRQSVGSPTRNRRAILSVRRVYVEGGGLLGLCEEHREAACRPPEFSSSTPPSRPKKEVFFCAGVEAAAGRSMGDDDSSGA